MLPAWLLPASIPAAAQAPPPPPLTRPVDATSEHPFEAPAQRWSAGHRGVDLTAAVGTPVIAAADGRVVFAGRVVSREVVSIDHAGGYRTTYEPVHAVVSPGDRVVAGQVVGYVEAGTECPGGCLHWGLRRGRDYLDPLAWLATTGVRLLPADARPATRRPPAAPPALLALLQAAPDGGELPPGALPPPSSGLVRPSSGPVSSPFGMRFHPVLHVWKLHDGLDFAADCGTPVRAAAAGRVVLVQAAIGYGNRVVVDHGTIGGHRVRTAYNHLSAFDVSAGQAVAQGQLVGRVGTTGFSTGCHLHLMVWRDGEVSDPARYVR